MSKTTNQVHNISELNDFMKENFNSKVYHSLNDVKKDFDLQPKEDYNISTCTEFAHWCWWMHEIADL